MKVKSEVWKNEQKVDKAKRVARDSQVRNPDDEEANRQTIDFNRVSIEESVREKGTSSNWEEVPSSRISFRLIFNNNSAWRKSKGRSTRQQSTHTGREWEKEMNIGLPISKWHFHSDARSHDGRKMESYPLIRYTWFAGWHFKRQTKPTNVHLICCALCILHSDWQMSSTSSSS